MYWTRLRHSCCGSGRWSGPWRRSIRTSKTAMKRRRSWRVHWARDGMTGPLTALVLELHSKIQSHPYPEVAAGRGGEMAAAALIAGRQRLRQDGDGGHSAAGLCSGRGSWNGPWPPWRTASRYTRANAAQFLAAAAERAAPVRAGVSGGLGRHGPRAAGAAAGRYGEKTARTTRPRRRPRPCGRNTRRPRRR